MMHVIGTAGHVDHGKSTLIAALTGIHPDRLKEEIQREMTIDLGFAWMILPNGDPVGIVDVPGHRDFIENMLAGVGGIDAALFVIAADEGVMPQTREHLAILDILQIHGGVIALTKIDLVDDPEWLTLVEEEIRGLISGTVMEDAPIIRVSAKTHQGIPELVGAIQTCLESSPARVDRSKPRLPIDRVFTIPGFGTVVTGTLLDGSLSVGDDVEILPGRIRSRIRGLQTHKQKETTATAGSRTAVNLSGVDLNQIARGETVVKPGSYVPTRRIDAQLRLLPELASPLLHNHDVKFFLNTTETQGRIRLLGCEEIRAGETAWVQIELRDEVTTVKGDHFILRRPSPGETLGGGVIIDPHAEGRYKRFSPQILQRLESRLTGTPEEKILEYLDRNNPISVQEVKTHSEMQPMRIDEIISSLSASGKIRTFHQTNTADGDLLVTTGYWNGLTQNIQTLLQDYHDKNPLRRGIPREELKRKLPSPPKYFPIFVQEWISTEKIDEHNLLFSLPGFEVHFNPEQQRIVDQLLQEFKKNPFSPPTIKACIGLLGQDVYNVLVDQGILRPVSIEVVFRVEDYNQMRQQVEQYLTNYDQITVAQFRDLFNTSRKYALGFLEHLDQIGVTIRDGDFRKLKQK